MGLAAALAGFATTLGLFILMRTRGNRTPSTSTTFVALSARNLFLPVSPIRKRRRSWRGPLIKSQASADATLTSGTLIWQSAGA